MTHDELLDNVMLYWLPGTAASSARLYWEKEIVRLSRRRAETRFKDLRYWNEPRPGWALRGVR